MKKLIPLTLIFLLSPWISHAQFSKFNLGANYGSNYLIGETPIKDSRVSPNLGLYAIYAPTANLAFKLQGGYGEMKTSYQSFSLKTKMLPIELIAMFAYRSWDRFTPFLHAGLGVMNFKINGSNRYYDGIVIGGAGLNIPLGPRFSFLLSADLRYTTGDDFNGSTGGLKDGYFALQGGFTIHLSRSTKKYEKRLQPVKPEIIAASPKRGGGKTGGREDVVLDLVKLRSKIQKLQDELDKKIAQIEELKTLVKIKNQKIQLYETRIAELQKQSSMKRETRLAGKERETPPPESLGGSVKQRYHRALRYFNSKNYRAAIVELTQLSKTYPQHRLASNFVYWIGESYFGLKNYSAALDSFKKVLAKFKGSSKYDDALLMSGICHMRLGKTREAQDNFQELLQKFPKSEYVGKARRLLESLSKQIIS